MAAPRFQPGFRISTIDCVIIVAGIVASAMTWTTAWWLGFIIAFVIAHFFLFCNIARVSRLLELIWSGIFVVLTFCTMTFEMPTWPITIVISLMATVVVVLLEMRKPSYHGILWQRINPNLPQWWAEYSDVQA